ncbi:MULTISPECIES: response regulator [Rhodopseudomonas]|uniref:response regulator n=1 Tax=Rhodopseudomonas TaxID=1073 RepID=UPI0005C850CD|nr:MULTISPECIES: response regulator [Rhodopseudomonas]MDF3809439.1 response regulator [Rhodopseudomonas sp. BAL398]WOK15487.1 response regulator [Rhodopseudomonas sp. BAL398]
MSTIRLLHIDDESDIREIVEISLGLDSAFEIRSCGSGEEGLTVAADWLPDVILLDVMMPLMDGPATLARLRENPNTHAIPVIFMTARAQTRELDRFRALGAVGVISKPFDPMTLAASVHNYVQAVDPLQRARAAFVLRAQKETSALRRLRQDLIDGGDRGATLAAIRQIAHGLAGAGGIFGFAEISGAGAALEDAISAGATTPAGADTIAALLDALILWTGQCQAASPKQPATLAAG